MVDTKDWIRTKSDEVAFKQHGCYFDISYPNRVREFFRTFIFHPKPPFAGKPFELLPWQWDKCIAPLFGWRMPDGTRRFRAFEQWIPKKNGKSTFSAALALYLLTSDGEYGAEVYSAAADRNQASIIYNEAKAMVEMSDPLMESLYVRKTKKQIEYPDANSKYEVLSADAFRNEGYNISALLFDELHTQRNRNMWNALRYGGAARRQPLNCVLSTAGEFDETLLWYERFIHSLKVQNSEVVDIHLLPCVYAMKDGQDWRSEETWISCNPSYGVALDKTQFKIDFEDALKNAANEASFLRYRLNKPTKFESAWIRQHYWNGCSLKSELDDESLPSVTFAGGDLSDNIDLNSLVTAKKFNYDFKGVMKSALYIKPTFWAPQEAGLANNQSNRERYLKWFDSGLLRQIEGPVAEQEVIEDDIVRLFKEEKVKELGLDRNNATRFATSMQRKFKLNRIRTKMRLMPYNFYTTNEPVLLLEGLITSGRLFHDDDEIMNWMFGNICCSVDSSGNRKLDKSKSKGKIDGFAALIVAVQCIMQDELTPESRYNTAGEQLLTLSI